jgi:hypothetical protein
MAVVVDEMEVAPAPSQPAAGPTPQAAPDLPDPKIDEQFERLLQVREQRAARLRAD